VLFDRLRPPGVLAGVETSGAVRHPAVRQPHDWEQRKSKQFKSARVVKTLPRTGVLLPTFLTSARGAQPNRGSVSFVGYPLARMTGHDLVCSLHWRVALDQPERRLHHDPDRGAEDLLHSRPSPLTAC